MSGFFDRLMGRGKDGSAGKAKARLEFILVHDRINLPPEKLNAMKQEILQVISKYVDVLNEKVEIALHQRERSNMIVAEIPFLKATEGEELPLLPDDEQETRPVGRTTTLDDTHHRRPDSAFSADDA